MSKRQEYTNELLNLLYNSKKNNKTLLEVNQGVKELIRKDISGMIEVINELNTLGYTHVVAKRGIGQNFFTTIPEDYLTLMGEEIIQNINKNKNNFINEKFDYNL